MLSSKICDAKDRVSRYLSERRRPAPSLQPLTGADEEAAELWCKVWRQLTEVEKRVCYVSEACGLEHCYSPLANSCTACQEKNLPACASSPSCQSEDTEMQSRRVQFSSMKTFIEPHTVRCWGS